MAIAKKIRRGMLFATSILISFIVVVIVFISPIAKYAIEKYSPKYLGRQVRVGWVYLNPFTGSIHLGNLKIFEYQSDSVFVYAKGVDANFAIYKMLSKTYEFTHLQLSKPHIVLTQDSSRFNFDDVINRFAPKGPRDTSYHEPLHFNLLNVGIDDGEIYYNQLSIPVHYYVKKVNLKTTGLRWNVDTIGGTLSFENGPGAGDISSDFMFNLKSLDYRIGAIVKKFDLNIIDQYLQDLSNYGTLRANLDANVHATGNFKDGLDVKAGGYLAVNDVHFGLVPSVDYASINKFAINIIELNPKNFRYYLDTIMVDSPYFKYERYDYLDNIQNMFGKNGETIKSAKADSSNFNLILKIADYVNLLAKNFIRSYYKINRIAIYRGNVKFNDYSLREKFGIAAEPLNLLTDTIDKNKERMFVDLKTGVRPYGGIHVRLSLDPNDYGYFDLDYGLNKLPLAIFNPYVISYTSFPLDRGTLDFNGSMIVDDSNIICNNHLLILDPRMSKRIKKNDTRWLPVPLLLSIVRERSDVIDYDIPIRGRLNDPKFKIWGVVGKIIGNLLIKPPLSPYLFHVKHLESQIEKSIMIKWDTRSNLLRPLQEKFVNRIVDFLKANPSAYLNIGRLDYTDKEKEYILFFMAKKKFFTNKYHLTSLSEGDSLLVDKMSVKDSEFVRVLNSISKDTLLFTVQEKCSYYLGKISVNQQYIQLIHQRESNFLELFKRAGVSDRVNFQPIQSGIPFNGFSYYKIGYNGEFPEKLIKAYNDIDELNEENPRGKYEKAREQNGGVLIEKTSILKRKVYERR